MNKLDWGSFFVNILSVVLGIFITFGIRKDGLDLLKVYYSSPEGTYFLKSVVDMSGDAFLREGMQEIDSTIAELESMQYDVADEMPSFKGGDANEFAKWVTEHLVYPYMARKQGIQGCVMIQFTIDTDGKVIDVTVLRGVDPDLDEEAVRVVSRSPKWSPGKIDGKPVRVAYTHPVIFMLR